MAQANIAHQPSEDHSWTSQIERAASHGSSACFVPNNRHILWSQPDAIGASNAVDDSTGFEGFNSRSDGIWRSGVVDDLVRTKRRDEIKVAPRTCGQHGPPSFTSKLDGINSCA